jgi:hypothetical protein
MLHQCQSPAKRRYNVRIAIATAFYLGFLFIEHRMMARFASPPLRYLLAALPALPVMAYFGIMGRYLAEEQDEYLRGITMIQALWATGLTLAAATLWGFLEDAGAPHLPMFYVAVGWFPVLGLVALVRQLADR